MPRAQNLARQERREVDPVKAARVGPGMGRTSTDEDLSQEEQRNDGKIHDCRPLARCRLSGKHLRMDMAAAAVPSEEIEPPECKQHRGSRAEQCDQAECSPQHCATRRSVSDRRIIWKIVVYE